MNLKTISSLTAALALLLTTVQAQAGNQLNTSVGLTLGGVPLAIHGYDAVAFFTSNQAVIGSDTHAVKHEGATYRFVSAENKATFEKNPARYLPQFGGFCAFGVSVGAKFDGDPRVFAVVGDKLYFNLNPDIQKKWKEDVPGNIVKAEDKWKTIADKAPSQLK